MNTFVSVTTSVCSASLSTIAISFVDGAIDGATKGEYEGYALGCMDGCAEIVGDIVGSGDFVGVEVGGREGSAVGFADIEGHRLLCSVGATEGTLLSVGDAVGLPEADSDGEGVASGTDGWMGSLLG